MRHRNLGTPWTLVAMCLWGLSSFGCLERESGDVPAPSTASDAPPAAAGGTLWFTNSPSQVALLLENPARLEAGDGIEGLKSCLPALASVLRAPKIAVVGYADLESAAFYDAARGAGAEYCYFNLENAHPALASTSPGTPERVALAIEVAAYAAGAIRAAGFKVAFDSGVQFKSAPGGAGYTAEAEFAQMADAICIQGYEYANNAPDSDGDGIPDANPQGAISNYLSNRSRLLAANPDLDFIFPAVGGAPDVVDGTAVTPDGATRPARPISQIVTHYEALLPVVAANGDYLQVFFGSTDHYEQFLVAIGR